MWQHYEHKITNFNCTFTCFKKLGQLCPVTGTARSKLQVIRSHCITNFRTGLIAAEHFKIACEPCCGKHHATGFTFWSRGFSTPSYAVSCCWIPRGIQLSNCCSCGIQFNFVYATRPLTSNDSQRYIFENRTFIEKSFSYKIKFVAQVTMP